MATKCRITSPGVHALLDGDNTLRCPTCGEDFDDGKIDFTMPSKVGAGKNMKYKSTLKCMACGCVFEVERDAAGVHEEMDKAIEEMENALNY